MLASCAPVVLPCFDPPRHKTVLYAKPPHFRPPLRRTPGSGVPAASRLPHQTIRRPGSLHITGSCVQAGCRAGTRLAPRTRPVRGQVARQLAGIRRAGRPALRSCAVRRGRGGKRRGQAGPPTARGGGRLRRECAIVPNESRQRANDLRWRFYFAIIEKRLNYSRAPAKFSTREITEGCAVVVVNVYGFIFLKRKSQLAAMRFD